MSSNSFNTRDTLKVDDATYTIYRLDRIDGAQRLPYSLKVLLENLLRNEDGERITPPRADPGSGVVAAEACAHTGNSVHAGAGADAKFHRRAVH
jgi:aconitase A